MSSGQLTKSDMVRQEIGDRIIDLLRGLTVNKDLDPFTLETQLCDTGLDSLCVAYLIGDIQHQYGLRDALYKAMVKADRPILTVRVYELVDCVCEILSKSVPR